MRCLSLFDDMGRFSPQYDDTQMMRIDADSVIVTIGQGTDVEFLKTSSLLTELQLTPKGTVGVNGETMQTNIPHIFASGELITGPNIAIQAIAGGRKAAWSIHKYLDRQPGDPEFLDPLPDLRKVALDLVDRGELRKVPTMERETILRLDIKARRGNWKEVNLGLDEGQALRGARRCLNCGIYCLRPAYESMTRDFLRKAV